MALSATWISPLLRANISADHNEDDGSSKGPPDASTLDARARAVLDAIRAAQGRVISPTEARAIAVLIKVLKALLGDTVDKESDDDEEV